MQELNQLIFFIFAFAFLGIFLGTYHSGYRFFNEIDDFWPLYLLVRAASFFFWGLAPWVGHWILALSNGCFFISASILGLLYRSWNGEIKKWQIFCVTSYAILLSTLIEYARQSGGSLNDRIFIASAGGLLLSVWHLFEVVSLSKRKRTLLPFLISVLLVVQIGILAGRAILVLHLPVDTYLSVVVSERFSTALFTWISFGTHLVICILTASYLYKRLYEQERLMEGNLALANKENKIIQDLLVERDRLLANLLRANKTSTSGALTASIAHELNQPLGANRLHLDHLNNLVDKGGAHQVDIRKTLHQISKNNDRASAIIKSLRAIFSEGVGANGISAVKAELQEIKELVSFEISSKKIEISIDAHDEISAFISPTEFKQVLLNLINNSIHALDSFSSDKKKINIFVKKIGDIVEIGVSDNGPGVREELLDGLFDMIVSNRVDGMGLGLWLVQHIVGSYGGSISYQPAVGGGALFTVKVPAR